MCCSFFPVLFHFMKSTWELYFYVVQCSQICSQSPRVLLRGLARRNKRKPKSMYSNNRIKVTCSLKQARQSTLSFLPIVLNLIHVASTTFRSRASFFLRLEYGRIKEISFVTTHYSLHNSKKIARSDVCFYLERTLSAWIFMTHLPWNEVGAENFPKRRELTTLQFRFVGNPKQHNA